jgi:lipid-binding SYLF domain-containing protein
MVDAVCPFRIQLSPMTLLSGFGNRNRKTPLTAHRWLNVILGIPKAAERLESMKKIILALCAGAVTLVSSQSFAANPADMNKRLQEAAVIIQEIQSVPAKAIPDWIVSKAYCVTVIPGYKKAAFIVGGSYGQGVATCRTHTGRWSAPAFVQLESGSWGLQIGGQSTDLVLVSVNEGGMHDLLKSKFKIGATASAAAGPVGRRAAADTNLTLHSELLTYSRSKGLFAGVDLSGAVIHQNTDDTRDFYGRDIPVYSILNGDIPTPPAGQHFVRTVERYFRATH